MKLEEKMNEIKAFMTDRIAQAIREANPNIGDKSFDRAVCYVNEIYSYIKTEIEKDYVQRDEIEVDEEKILNIIQYNMPDSWCKNSKMVMKKMKQLISKADIIKIKEKR